MVLSLKGRMEETATRSPSLTQNEPTMSRKGRSPAPTGSFTFRVVRLAWASLRFGQQFVDRRPAHHASDGHQGTDRRHQNGISGLQLLNSLAHPAQKQVVEVHLPQQLLAAIMLDDAQRSGGRRAASRIQSVQWRRESADVISPRTLHISDDVHPQGPDAAY